MKKTIGLIVNPLAGLGGKSAHKGSDAAHIRDLYRKKGNIDLIHRIRAALLECKDILDMGVHFLTAPEDMGEDILQSLSIPHTVIGQIQTGHTTGQDTEHIASLMAKQGVDCLVFAGGDGTARNMYNALGTTLPVLGLPSGVKMHSPVFTINARAAGTMIRNIITGPMMTGEREVLDIDEEAYRKGQVHTSLYGYLNVCTDANLLQGKKVGGLVHEQSILEEIASRIHDEMKTFQDFNYIIGPGSTTKAIKEYLAIDGSLLGVDVIREGKLLYADATEETILRLMEGKNNKIIITPIGGQGHIFGRGNQQISSKVLQRVPREHIHIVASMQKMATLPRHTVSIDIDDEKVHKSLTGIYRVIVGRHQEVVCRAE